MAGFPETKDTGPVDTAEIWPAPGVKADARGSAVRDRRAGKGTEVFTWPQLGPLVKPVGLFNFRRFHDPMLRVLDGRVEEGFLIPAQRAAMLAVETDRAAA